MNIFPLEYNTAYDVRIHKPIDYRVFVYAFTKFFNNNKINENNHVFIIKIYLN